MSVSLPERQQPSTSNTGHVLLQRLRTIRGGGKSRQAAQTHLGMSTDSAVSSAAMLAYRTHSEHAGSIVRRLQCVTSLQQ